MCQHVLDCNVILVIHHTDCGAHAALYNPTAVAEHAKAKADELLGTHLGGEHAAGHCLLGLRLGLEMPPGASISRSGREARVPVALHRHTRAGGPKPAHFQNCHVHPHCTVRIAVPGCPCRNKHAAHI